MIKSPDVTDRHVGLRIRMRRLMLDMSQTKLGDATGVTFQQVQKYEKGTNRISASKLDQMSRILQVPVAFFFEGLPKASGRSKGKSDPSYQPHVLDFISTTEGLALIKAFVKIKDRSLSRQIIQLIETLAER
jgi:transcriptional regulator with XRE-family HTH domain